MSPPGCVTGRFQPPHAQHLELFAFALERHAELIVAVTNPDAGARRADDASPHRHRPEANPFTYYERVRLLGAALAQVGWRARTTIVPFDLSTPEAWFDYVPPEAVHYVRAYAAWERRKAELLAAAGYAVEVLDGDPAGRVSGQEIRAALGVPGWEALVPDATVGVLAELLAARSLAARAAA